MVERVRPGVVRIESGDSVGTGVVFRSDNLYSYILTNAHVVEGREYVTVTLRDTGLGTWCPVLGVDPVRDLAVVQTFNTDWPTLPFGDASALRPGDRVVAMGYALGIRGAATVTEGIVSAVRYESSNQRWLIQTDAAINPGNSGGPLFNMAGEVVGINTFKLSDVVVEGLGFAVSAVTVKQQIESLMTAPPRPPTPTPTPRGTCSGRCPGSCDTSRIMSGLKPSVPSDSASGMLRSRRRSTTRTSANQAATGAMGSILRWTTPDSNLRVFVDSTRRWGVDHVFVRLGGGQIGSAMLHLGAGEANHIRFVARANQGRLYVNGVRMGTVSLDAIMHSGGVSIGTGFYYNHEREGAVTRYENFKGKVPD